MPTTAPKKTTIRPNTQLEQVDILRNLKHANIVEMHQFYPAEPMHYYVVLEYMAGGKLIDRIAKKVFVTHVLLQWLLAWCNCCCVTVL